MTPSAQSETKYIFVTGGVVSSVGKGITTASLGRMLRNRGFRVTIQKLDPYINVDADTMDPFQHGEAFVTNDGAVTDLDLGHYERFVDVSLTRTASVTTGSVYASVIEKERGGHYRGATVQTIPHVTDEIKARIRRAGEEGSAESDGRGEGPADVVIAEVGGTVGDIEGLPFLEAIRQFKKDVGATNVLYVHVTLVPSVGPWAEVKTKPTQHSVIKLREIGIQPDVLICRTSTQLSEEVIRKISLFCDVDERAVIEAADVESIYEVPLRFEAAHLADLVAERLALPQREPDLAEWTGIVDRIKAPTWQVDIACVGKYVENPDAYISITEALRHAGIANDARVNLTWIDSEDLAGRPITDYAGQMDAILVAPGFGGRGVDGKIAAASHARCEKIPFLGVCYGMQMATVEFARNVANLEGAHSAEVDPNTPHPLIHIMPDQVERFGTGGTMRLGAQMCRVVPNTLASRLYGTAVVYERHRHRFEFNNAYRAALERHGMVCSGLSADYRLVEIVELADHPFFIATQFHPEFRSRPNRAHPLFKGLVEAALARRRRPFRGASEDSAADAEGGHSGDDPSPAVAVVAAT